MSKTAVSGMGEHIPPPPREASRAQRLLRHAVLLVLGLGILGAAVGIAFHWLTNRPTAARRPPERQATLVEVLRVAAGEATIVVEAMGTVVPALQAQVASRVRGEVAGVAPEFIPGGRFQAGDVLVRIDPKDYELAVRTQKSQVRQAEAQVRQAAGAVEQRRADIIRVDAELRMETGRKSAALGEYELLGETVKPEDEALVLREPQLKQAEADCAAARAAKQAADATLAAAKEAEAASRVALEQAELDLARTDVSTRFNAVVQARHVDWGSLVSVGSPVATLVGTDEYWIEVSVPLDELKWIRIPGFNSENGSTVRVYGGEAWGADAHRVGTAARLVSEIESEGRMARVLVSVRDPLDLQTPAERRRPLILGDFLSVEIVGREVEYVTPVDRGALHEGRQVWVMSPDGTLDIREVTVVWGGKDYVLVSDGLRSGDLLVVSDIGAPVQGMALRTPGARSAPDGRPATRPNSDGQEARR